MTTTDIQQAKEWAESRASGNYLLSEGTKEAVKVIQSLPDHIIDAEGLATLSDLEKSAQHAAFGTDGELTREQLLAFAANVERTIHKLLTPPLPTLADMTPEEREACLWMQVDLPRHLPGAVLTDPGGHGLEPRVMYQDGATFTVEPKDVTPLPGEPKLGWPWDGVVDAEIVEDEPTPPRPEDVPEGEPWIVLFGGKRWVGIRDKVRDLAPWSLMRMDGADIDDVRDFNITLISRLVPEVKP